MMSASSVSGSDPSLDMGGTPDAVIVWGPGEVEDLAQWCAARGVWFRDLEPEGLLARIEALSAALEGD